MEALKAELSKLGATITVTEHSLHLEPAAAIIPEVSVATYQDHRMAMAFAPLSIKAPILIKEAEVVSKSYPEYWDHLKQLGLNVEFE